MKKSSVLSLQLDMVRNQVEHELKMATVSMSGDNCISLNNAVICGHIDEQANISIIAIKDEMVLTDDGMGNHEIENIANIHTGVLLEVLSEIEENEYEIGTELGYDGKDYVF